MALSDLAVRQAKVTGKDYTLADGDGLSLFVLLVGGKSWHFRGFGMGKQKRMSLGTYLEVTLREARAVRHEVRAPRGQERQSINPCARPQDEAPGDAAGR